MSNAESKVILIVEDDEDVRLSLQEILELEGYEVEGVIDGEEALQRARRDPRPALIILDVMMPRLSGLHFLEIRSKDERLESIPIVIATASGLSCVEHEVLAVLPKPLDLDVLLQIVHATCGSPAQSC